MLSTAFPRMCRIGMTSVVVLRAPSGVLAMLNDAQDPPEPVGNCLLRQPHLELDGAQLLGRLSDALQEWQPAWIVMDAGK